MVNIAKSVYFLYYPIEHIREFFSSILAKSGIRIRSYHVHPALIFLYVVLLTNQVRSISREYKSYQMDFQCIKFNQNPGIS